VPPQHRKTKISALEFNYSSRQENARRRGDGHAVTLITPRQLEIVRFVADGATDRQIAMALSLSPRTVSNTLHRVYDRIGVSSRARLAALYVKGVFAERTNGHARGQAARKQQRH
jgi:DNA-binding CsgD family transcriptional regulator